MNAENSDHGRSPSAGLCAQGSADPPRGGRPWYFTAEGQVKNLSSFGELKGPAKDHKFATGRLGLRPASGWALLSGCSFWLSHLTSGLGNLLSHGKSRFLKRKAPFSHSIAGRAASPAAWKPCHSPCIGRWWLVATASSDPAPLRPWQAAFRRTQDCSSHPACPLPVVLSSCKLFSVPPACSAAQFDKGADGGPLLSGAAFSTSWPLSRAWLPPFPR